MADVYGTAATTGALAAMGPVGWALAAVNLAGGIFGARSAHKQREKLKAELERRRLAMIQSKNLAMGRVAEGTAAAKAPLEAIAERIRTEEGFRDPVLEQSVAAGARASFGSEMRRAEATQGSAGQALDQQQLMMAAVLSQAMLGRESQRLQQRFESTRALTGIYSRLSEITQAGAQSAAGIETQFAGMLQGEPLLNGGEGNDPIAAGIGGMLSFLGTDTGKGALGALFKLFQGQGYGDGSQIYSAFGGRQY